MSLRLVTVTLTLAGLLLYTLSLLSEPVSQPSQQSSLELEPGAVELPGTNVYPLLYRDPAFIDYEWEILPDSIELYPPTSITRPGHDSIESLRPFTIQTTILQEVVS